MAFLEQFLTWKSRYILHLEKENERLVQELRHWQSQLLTVMRVTPLPNQPGEPLPPAGEPKKVTMPKSATFHQAQKKDQDLHDKNWAEGVVATNLELTRAYEERSKLSHNGVK